MPLSVNLPKMVSIHNRRLAIVHFSMMASMLLGLLSYKFYYMQEHYGQLPIVTALEVQWEEEASIDGMQEFFALNAREEAVCTRAEEGSDTVVRWKTNWTRQVKCTRMCNLYEFLDHAYFRNRTTCWAGFKDFGMNQSYTPIQFMTSKGTRDVSVITSKRDWYVDHAGRSTTNLLEIVVQAKAAVLELGYSYKLMSQPMWFPFTRQHKVDLTGDQKTARTLILDANGHPVGSPIPPGDPIRIAVDDMWLYAERADDQAAHPLSLDVLGSGAEVRAEAACFGDDTHLLEYLTHNSQDLELETKDFGASLRDVVCAIRFKQVSYDYQLHSSYSAPPSGFEEVLSETVGISIKVIESSTYTRTWDANALLLQITSIVVLLAMPMEVTRIIATRLLGPLSTMYKRVVVEPYNIEEVAAMTSTVLAQNMVSFYQLSDLSEDGPDTIKLQAIQVLMQKAFAHRTDDLSERELLSLAHFLYEGLCSKKAKGSDVSRGALLGLFFDVELGGADEESSTAAGITLDQWNQCRLDCEKITFEALVKLFDKDRQRNFFERLFTPNKIKEALKSAMDGGEKLSSVFDDFEDKLWHSSASTKTDPSALVLQKQSSLLQQKFGQYFATDSCYSQQPIAANLSVELAELSERVRVVEEAMAGSSLMANEADGPRLEDSHQAASSTSGECTDALAQLPPGPAPEPTSDSASPPRPKMELPVEAQPALPATDSRRLREALSVTLLSLSEKLTSIESSVNALAEDFSRFRGTSRETADETPAVGSNTSRARDDYWAKVILDSLPPDVVQDLGSLRETIEEREQRRHSQRSSSRSSSRRRSSRPVARRP